MPGLGHLPSTENLQCFVAAAEHLNFRNAAKEVALTPTAFGQRIRQLEEQLDQRLFERTTRHVSLTPAGSRLLPQARVALERARHCMDVVHSLEARPARFRLGTRFELGMSWIVPAVKTFRQTRPHWHVDLYFGSGPDILERLRLRQVDCIVTSAPVARKEWSAEFLHPEEYVFVGAPALLDRRPLDEIEQARDHTLLDINDSLPLTRYLTSAGTPLQFGDIWEAGSGASMIELACAGHGVCVLPNYMVRPHLQDGRLRQILPDLPILQDSFRLLFRSDSPMALAFEELAGLLRDRPLE